MLAEEWVNSINRFSHKKALEETTEILAKLPEDMPIDELIDTKETQTFKLELFERYNMLEDVCNSQVKAG